MRKKITIVGLILVMLSALTGCKGGAGTKETLSTSAKDYVYRVEALSYENEAVAMLFKGGEKTYAYGYNWEDDGSSWVELLTLSADDKVENTGKITLGINEGMGSITADGKGNIFAMKTLYEDDGEGMSREHYFLLKLNEQGEELLTVDFDAVPELEPFRQEEYFYAGSLLCDGDSLYVNIMGKYVQFDTDGNFVKVMEGADWDENEGVTLYLLEDGKVGALTYEDTGLYVCYVDMETGTFSEKSKLPGTSYEYSVYPGSGYDFYLVNSYGVYGYNVGDADKTQLMNYIDSDLGIYSIYNVSAINDKEFYATYDDMETGRTQIGHFVKVDPSEVKDKQVLVLACNGLDWDVRTAVVKFNKNNENYRISIQDYASLYGTEEDYMAGINRLNADILSGKVPDIVLINSNMPVDSYIAKGLFEDLKPYIENDAEIDMNNLAPNIIEAYSLNGKLYQLVPSYYIGTLVAKTADVGDKKSWTIQEMKDVLAQKPEGCMFLPNLTRDSMLHYILPYTQSQFIDRESGKCNFDSQEFIDLLEFIKEFPEEIDEAIYTDDYWESYDSMWRDGKVLAQITTIVNFREYNYVEKGTFGEEITMIGFPCENGEGSAINANLQMAMSAKSSLKDGAWEFMRYYLTDEYQNEITYGLPISMKRMDELMLEATKVPTYTDGDGNEIESPDMYYVGGMEIVIDPMTEKEAQQLKEEILKIHNVYSYDEKLIAIIQEETAGFFAGQKSAEQVAEIIQSRAQIYVNENR